VSQNVRLGVNDSFIFINEDKNEDKTVFIPIIICCDTGVRWFNQCCHIACRHNSAEGYLIYFKSEADWSQERYEKIVNEDGKLCNWPGYLTGEDKKSTAEYIDSYFKGYKDGFIKEIRFDHERIEELEEAWVPVKITIDSDKLYYELYDSKSECEREDVVKNGYFCPENCD
jgi:Family of unknown function (DUF6210)